MLSYLLNWTFLFSLPVRLRADFMGVVCLQFALPRTALPIVAIPLVFSNVMWPNLRFSPFLHSALLCLVWRYFRNRKLFWLVWPTLF